MLKKINSVWLYRSMTILGVVVAIILVLVIPQKMKEPDDWAYYYAAENFSHGRLVLDNALHRFQVEEARGQGGQLIQYVRLGENRWAFEKAPGYVFYLVPFHLAHIPQLANILLVIGLAAVSYLLLKRLRDEKTACLGSLLLLFTPVSLAMLQRAYMDSFASMAFFSIGGGLYIYYGLSLKELNPRLAGLLLFAAGVGLGCAVAARYTNAIPVMVFGLHFLVTRIRLLAKGQGRAVVLEAIYLGLGAALPLAALLIYHQAVFGSPWDYGYNYTQLPVKFAFDYIGQSAAWDIVRRNLSRMPAPLLVGFPLLLLALPALGIILYQKIIPLVPSQKRKGRTEKWPELRWDILLLLTSWILAVFVLYLGYEWTANQSAGDMPFIVTTRFYLPAILPLAMLSALLLVRLPKKLMLSIMMLSMFLGLVFFVQSALGELGLRPPLKTQYGGIPQGCYFAVQSYPSLEKIVAVA